MDNRAEPPSWRSGAGPAAGGRVTTGVGPPAADQGEDDHSQAHSADEARGYAADGPQRYTGGSGAFADNDQAPAFSRAAEGAPPPSFSDSSPHTDFGSPFGAGYSGSAAPDGQPRMPDTPEAHEGGPPGQFAGMPSAGPGFGNVSAGYGDGVGAAPGFGVAPRADPYGPPASALGGPAQPGPGFAGYSTGAPDYSGGAPAFDDEQLADPFGNNPAAGAMYGSEAPPGTVYPPQENRTASQAYSPEYTTQPPLQSAKAKVTASLKAARRVKVAKRSSRPGRQAQLTVTRLEPWSVMKFSFVVSLVAFIVLFVAVAVLYGVLAGLGVFTSLQHAISSITSSQGSSGFNIQSWLSASRVLGYAGLLGAINVVLITALATVGAVLYNITSDLAGGIEITLKETE